MLTYALFIASDPDPVSSSDWAHLDEVFDRARLSSGGTKVHVRATETPGPHESDFEQDVATFVNGIRLEVRDDGPDAFAYLGDGRQIATANRDAEQWHLVRDPALSEGDADEVATFSVAGHSRDEAQAAFGRFVEDWLS